MKVLIDQIYYEVASVQITDNGSLFHIQYISPKSETPLNIISLSKLVFMNTVIFQ